MSKCILCDGIWVKEIIVLLFETVQILIEFLLHDVKYFIEIYRDSSRYVQSNVSVAILLSARSGESAVRLFCSNLCSTVAV